MGVTDENFQPMGPQLIIHGIPTIDTLNEKSGICSPATSAIVSMPNNTHGGVFVNVVGQGTVLEEAVGNYKTDFEIVPKIPNFKSSTKILKRVYHLWIQLLLVKKYQAQKHQQWNLQHVKKNHENSKYQRTLIGTQIFRLGVEQFWFF